MSESRRGIAIILAHADAASARSAFTLALTARLAEDPAAVFITSDALDWVCAAPTGDAGLEDNAPVRTLRDELIAAEGGLIACSASLEQAELGRGDLLDGVQVAGAMRFYQHATNSAVSLYI